MKKTVGKNDDSELIMHKQVFKDDLNDAREVVVLSPCAP